MELGAPTLKRVGAWSAEISISCRSAEIFQDLQVEFYKKKEKKKDIRTCGARKIHVEMVERGAKK